MPISRDELYEAVWAETMTRLAAKYGVSSQYLGRVCERLRVPRPPMGYWEQLKVGKARPRPPLPDSLPGDEVNWVRGREFRPTTGPLEARATRRRPVDTPDATEHHLLVGVQPHFEGGRETESGYLRPAKRDIADVVTSKGALSRALAVANELFLLLERHGHRVVLAPRDVAYRRLDLGQSHSHAVYTAAEWSPRRPTLVFVGAVAVGLTIFEISSEVEVRWVDGKYVRLSSMPPRRRSGSEFSTTRSMPSGLLGVRAYAPYANAEWQERWEEKHAGELETRMRSIAGKIRSAAPNVATLVQEGERRVELERQRWELERAQWQRQEDERRRVQARKDSEGELVRIIERWARARNAEDFFTDVESRAEALEPDDRSALLERLARAKELFGGTDALEYLRLWRAPEER